MKLPLEPKTLTAAAALAILWAGELCVPFYPEFGNWKQRLRHDGKNVSVGLCNALAVGLFAVVTLAVVDRYVQQHAIGLLRLVACPVWFELLVAFLLLDIWMYMWHRANHVIPFLWRFHRMHHSDPQLDATTGFRFHTGEELMSAAARLVVLPAIGADLWQLAVYESVFLPIVLLHHSNVKLPRWLDYGLLVLFVTPAMHRVHHSRWRAETDSNYGSVFPYWDLLLGTMRLRRDARTIPIGLDELDGTHWQSFWGMLRTPFAGGIHRPEYPDANRAIGPK